MTWTLAWSWVAEHRDFYEVRPLAAERIDAALQRLADTGRGPIAQISPDDPNLFRLRVPGAEARLFIDRQARTVFVLRIYRRS